MDQATTTARRLTRSTSRGATTPKRVDDQPTHPSNLKSKKKLHTSKRLKLNSSSITDKESSQIVKLIDHRDVRKEEAAVPFSITDARAHLLRVDPRFETLFDRLSARPFDLDSQDDTAAKPSPNSFKSLCYSIFGQQVSAQASRAIIYRFIRLFNPELDEKLDPMRSTSSFPFPTPSQVIKMPTDRLRSAGLSQRKTEYIVDLASRFSDGRLSNDSLLAMDKESVIDELCAVRGIGRWTVDMFLIFTAINPDILPCADLSIQKAMLRWYTSTPLPSSPKKKNSTPVSPLSGSVSWTDMPAPPIPPGCLLSLSTLKSRLEKPLKPGLYLTPKEMEQLAEPWKPYRSIPICYFWSMTDVVPEY
ncbi:DNA glycosylase [Phakopsora pachyrhizi]|uniref:DNA glycosylase n=1 Tax=Phakopsora pachyrhizi TaxID=170000 RepID=A0AAV0BRX2_PHAPC|nr:DNA glycosylase [Phakopsora pachyrhizi]